MSMQDIINGDDDDVNTFFPHGEEDHSSSSPQPHQNDRLSDEMQLTHHNDLFEHPDDVTMFDRSAAQHSSPSDHLNSSHDENLCNSPDSRVDCVCLDLQAKLTLDANHLKIAMLASKCFPEDRHANLVFANAAYHQLTSNITNSGRVAHVFDDQFRDFDAVDKQPDSWKADHLAPGQIEDNSTALQAYRGTMRELLKHQRSHLHTLLLTNILETQRIAVKGKVPNCNKMITTIYEDLPPDNEKMTTSQIKYQVKKNWPMRIRIAYMRLVMVHYYAHKPKKSSQWLEIDERLGILRDSTIEFQHKHAELILAKDTELFSYHLRYGDIPKDSLTVPSLADVPAAMSSSASGDQVPV
ncbi:hypothetical protein PCANC_02621 [Puccinia coronata f. sp. avenae]|uniref:Uncharacterized protein n=1 Tax=Puccinia coronata f. sp. avenae TaxID=200324 RepID=A0A2N5W5M2_9BASI|nr:hypothetical protein PCANC_02621 [Puccinia coronata f. sp. avenae]